MPTLLPPVERMRTSARFWWHLVKHVQVLNSTDDCKSSDDSCPDALYNFTATCSVPPGALPVVPVVLLQSSPSTRNDEDPGENLWNDDSCHNVTIVQRKVALSPAVNAASAHSQCG